MRLTLGTDLTPIAKEQLGQVAYEKAREYAPDLWWIDWEYMAKRYQEMWIAVAVSVRGFHPDA